MSQKNSVTSLSNAEQLIVSYELLLILRWIVQHETNGLKKLINHAVASSDHLKRVKTGSSSEQSFALAEDIKHTITDLFDLLEMLLSESLNEHAVNKIIERNLMPAIAHIDANACDDTTIRQSIEKTTQKIDQGSQEDAQTLLFKELLRSWKPSKKGALN